MIAPSLTYFPESAAVSKDASVPLGCVVQPLARIVPVAPTGPAAAAPAGFFGNTYSSFSKGVALLRAGGARAGGTSASPSGSRGSFAYDCLSKEMQTAAAPEKPTPQQLWKLSAKQLNEIDASSDRSFFLHPGFSYLEPAQGIGDLC